MKNAAFATESSWSLLAPRLIIALTLAATVIFAPAYAIRTNSGAATVLADPPGTQHSGSDYVSITGARVGAPSEQEISTYGGSHKHLWVQRQLYGPGVVNVPRVHNAVHQSR